jgi:hypothetical protein
MLKKDINKEDRPKYGIPLDLTNIIDSKDKKEKRKKREEEMQLL